MESTGVYGYTGNTNYVFLSDIEVVTGITVGWSMAINWVSVNTTSTSYHFGPPQKWYMTSGSVPGNSMNVTGATEVVAFKGSYGGNFTSLDQLGIYYVNHTQPAGFAHPQDLTNFKSPVLGNNSTFNFFDNFNAAMNIGGTNPRIVKLIVHYNTNNSLNRGHRSLQVAPGDYVTGFECFYKILPVALFQLASMD